MNKAPQRSRASLWAAFWLLAAAGTTIPPPAFRLQAETANPAIDGARQFMAQCGTCHSVESGQTRLGPSLAHIVGRRAGTQAGFTYSEPLQQQRIVWTRANLDAWIADSRKFAPGTTMAVRIADPAKRTAIINYLQSQR